MISQGSNRLRNTIQLFAHEIVSLLLLTLFAFPAHAEEVFNLRLDSRPFSPGLCQKQHERASINIRVAGHRDLLIQRIPGQYVPQNSGEARRKDYTHFITLNDLTNGTLLHGAIAFRSDRAIIFTEKRPTGMSRRAFVSTLPSRQQPIAVQALNTFLRIQSIINAAIDTCRPYPPTVTYGTDDEIDRIEAGRSSYRNMIETYNKNPTPQQPLFLHEAGMSEGFFDPEEDQRKTVSYQAMNPLSFYVP